jgi:hypothetical protein
VRTSYNGQKIARPAFVRKGSEMTIDVFSVLGRVNFPSPGGRTKTPVCPAPSPSFGFIPLPFIPLPNFPMNPIPLKGIPLTPFPLFSLRGYKGVSTKGSVQRGQR